MSATPTTMLLEGDGSELDWHVGYGPPPERFLAKLEKSIKGIDTYKALSESYAKDPKNVEVVFKLAQKYDDKYVEDKALELYKKVLVLDPEGKKGTTDYGEEKVTYTEYAEYSIGSLAVFSRKMDPEPLKAFIKKYPDSKILKEAYGRLSYYYRSRAPKDEAKVFFEEYTSKYPDDPNVLSSYIRRIIRDKDNLDKGIELAEKIKEMMKYNPNPRHTLGLAELYVLKGDKEKADEVYGKRFMEGQVSSLAYSLADYAEFWVKNEMNTENAEEMMELALKIMPDRWYNFQRGAEMYLKLGKEDKALDVFGPEFIKKHKDDEYILNSYARFWANQGKNMESALEAVKKSIVLAESAFNMDTLALVYQKLGKYEEALKAAERAVEIADEEVKARFKSRINQIKKAMAEKKKKDN